MSLAEQAKRVYESRLRAQLEASHSAQFVAIEPVSESYFLGDEFIDAAMAARNAYPDRRSFVIRVGHDAAFHIGGVAIGRVDDRDRVSACEDAFTRWRKSIVRRRNPCVRRSRPTQFWTREAGWEEK